MLNASDDGLNAELSNKSRMSTEALITYLQGNIPPGCEADFVETIDELFFRHVVKPKIRNGESLCAKLV